MHPTPSEPGGAPLRVGVIGTGALGHHHTRIAAAMPGVELVGIYDIRPEVAKAVGEKFGARVFPDLDSLAAGLDAAVLAVPTVFHCEIGCRLLEAGIHLLVEKPIAGSLEEADRLLEAAAAGSGRERVVAVGHVEFHNPAVQAVLSTGLTARFVEVHRLSRFTHRSLDVDVVLDLMIHDLQILHALDPSPVAEVRATGIEVLSERIDIANARVALESGCVANLTASRVSAEPVRKLRVFFESAYFSLDYREQEIKGARLVEEGEERRIVPAELPFEKGEPLWREQEAFYAACRGEAAPLVDGRGGRRALATAMSVVEAIRGH